MAQENVKQFVYVGLGNPGKEYTMTRHNIGHLVVQKFANDLGLTLKPTAHFEAELTKGQFKEIKFHCLFPTTYMNESGRAVRRYIDFFKIHPNQVIVIHDDVDLPFGQLRLKTLGGAGTHNGLKSVEKHLGTKHYARLRMGIGFNPKNQDLSDYVLSRFNAEESALLDSFIEKGVAVLKRLISEEMTLVMNDVNRKANQKQKTDLLQNEGQEKNDDSR